MVLCALEAVQKACVEEGESEREREVEVARRLGKSEPTSKQAARVTLLRRFLACA